jgi:predicted PurR-regulated permease PerM
MSDPFAIGSLTSILGQRSHGEFSAPAPNAVRENLPPQDRKMGSAMTNPRRDLVTSTLGVVFLGGLIYVTFLILQPMMTAIIWATLIVVATWPVLLKIQARLGNSRSWATAAMTGLLLLLMVVPLTMVVVTLARHSVQILERVQSIPDFRLPPLPAKAANIPVLGDLIASGWERLQDSGINDVLVKLQPYAGVIARWTAAQFADIGVLLVQFLLTVIIAGIMYATGETAADAVRRFGRRLAGERGESMVVLSAQAIRGVALGIGVTAVVQSALGGIGLIIAGVPFAGLLTVLMLILCLAQLGPSLVLLAAVIWVYWTGDTGWGTFLLIWSVIVSLSDNVIRPALIRMGADLPTLLILAGVLGGMIAFGLVGIFIGPVVLAVAYTLLISWMAEDREPAMANPD